MPLPASSTRAAIVAALARPADLRAQDLVAVHLVSAVRVCALADHAGRDALPELAGRYGNVDVARGVLTLVRTIGRTWPEPYVAGRPCCMAMTPDERTLAAMVQAARAGNRPAFCAAIEGFIRPARHDRLFDATVRAVAGLPCA